MIIGKKVYGISFLGTSLKNTYKKIMVHLWENIIEEEFKPDFDERVQVEVVSIKELTTRNKHGKEYDVSMMGMELITTFDYEEQVKMFCNRCRNELGLDWSPTVKCDKCNLKQFNEYIGRKLDKRVRVQREKLEDKKYEGDGEEIK